jgi:hypothetical protein
LRSPRVLGHLFNVRNQFLKKNWQHFVTTGGAAQSRNNSGNFGSTSLPLEVQHKAATTPEILAALHKAHTRSGLLYQATFLLKAQNFGSESAHKIRSPLSGHLSLESTKFWQRKRIQDQVTFIRPPFS